jgi:hypothetical protein
LEWKEPIYDAENQANSVYAQKFVYFGAVRILIISLPKLDQLY